MQKFVNPEFDETLITAPISSKPLATIDNPRPFPSFFEETKGSKIVDNKLIQTATFRPVGLGGRLYWLLVYPFHGVIFQGLIKKLSIQ